jgi:hypothetical protein
MLRNRLEVEDDKGTVNITIILKTLSDGNWHNFDDLPAETKLEKETVLRIANFFRDYGFIEISNGGEAAKLDQDYLKL